MKSIVLFSCMLAFFNASIASPTPNVNPVSNQVVCSDAATSAVVFTGSLSGTTYSWTGSTTAIGLAASGSGNIASFVATNATNVIIMDTLIVIPSAGGYVGTPDTFMITVNPTPGIDAISNQVLCNNATVTPVIFSGSEVSGTTYSWTGSTSAIGLAADGTSNINSFTATNGANAVTTDTVVVTPSANGCAGEPDTFKIIVDPTPIVNAVANQVLCNNEPTIPILFAGSVSGTGYSWTSNTTYIGLASSGSGNIVSFTAINSTNVITTDTVIVTPSANSCVGTPDTFMVVVNPTPNVSPVVNRELCNNTTNTAIVFAGSVSGTTYSWTGSTAAVDIAISGSGNIASSTAINTTNTIMTDTIIVTPLANGCVGIPDTFKITVDPTPSVNAISNQVLCNNASTTAVSFVGLVSGTSYSWIGSTSAIGLAADGASNINPFTVTNGTNALITDTIFVTPSANGCVGAPDTFMITVYPTPTVLPVTNFSACNNTTISSIIFNSSVSVTSYIWTNSNTSIGLGSTGDGNIPSFEAINTGTIVTTAMIAVVPSAYGCAGNTYDFVITVDPPPAVPAIKTESPNALCSGTFFQNFGAASLGTTDSSYTWGATNANVYATGSTSQYALISFNTPGTSVVTLSYKDPASCSSQASYTVTVGNGISDDPIVIYSESNLICLQYNVDSYQWGYDDISTLDSTILPGEINQNYSIGALDPTKLYWVITMNQGCMQKSYYVLPAPGNHRMGTTNSGSALAAMGETEVKVYPNPARDEVNINIVTSSITGDLQIEVLNLLGQNITSVPAINNEANINVSSFSTGVYLIECYCDGKKISTTKFIKN